MSDISDDEIDEFKAEASAFERAGPGGLLNSLLSPETLEKLSKPTGGRVFFPPEDLFLLTVNSVSRDLSDQGYEVTQTDIDYMLNKSQEIGSTLKYKNATAYVLGYLVTKGGRQLSIEGLQRILRDVLPKIPSTKGIEPPDVLRYSRYWTQFLKP